MKNSLAVAIEALSWMAYAGLGERTALFKAADQMRVNRADELRQAHRLIMETTRFQNRLDHFTSQTISAGEVGRVPHGIRSFLRIVAYLKYVEGARQKELVRTVAIARQILGWRELQPFEKQLAEIVSGKASFQSDALPEFDRLSLETCHPAWLVHRLVRVFGRSFALRMLRRDLQPMHTYVRLNPIRVTSKTRNVEIEKKLDGSKVEELTDIFLLDQNRPPFSLIESGEVVMQDLASIVAGYAASANPGDKVLDVCAAPGNKTAHLAAQMHNEGVIYSFDISANRLTHWKKEMLRWGCEIAIPVRADARRIPAKVEVDVVLVDPPCSNTGVFARNPAVKWKLTPTRIREFSVRQESILQAASEHVAMNGALIYCTCSLLPEENEYVIEAFLMKNPQFKIIAQEPFLGSPGLRGLDLCQRFYPHLHECNGYFIAKLERTG